MRVLFIGNSHTYYNDMPALFGRLCEEKSIPCQIAMIAHGGWFLSQHIQEPDVSFNIRYGNYDYVVLQEHAHPFGPVEEMRASMATLSQWIHQAKAMPVAYMTWQEQNNGQAQPAMTAAYEDVAADNHMLLAPVGKLWWEKLYKEPDTQFYDTDGQHASPEGSAFAARILFETIMAHENARF